MSLQLIASAVKGDTDRVLKLLQDGADIHATDGSGPTAILAATRNKQVGTVQAVIEKGADVNIRDSRLDNVWLYAEGKDTTIW